MFNNLPKFIQQQIIVYLEADNFKAAKELRDYWLSQKHAIANAALLLFNPHPEINAKHIANES